MNLDLLTRQDKYCVPRSILFAVTRGLSDTVSMSPALLEKLTMLRDSQFTAHIRQRLLDTIAGNITATHNEEEVMREIINFLAEELGLAISIEFFPDKINIPLVNIPEQIGSSTFLVSGILPNEIDHMFCCEVRTGEAINISDSSNFPMERINEMQIKMIARIGVNDGLSR